MGVKIHNDFFDDVTRGVNASLKFNVEDTKFVIDACWASFKVRPGLERQAELELKPKIKLVVENVSLEVEADQVVAKFKSREAEAAFNELRRGGTWYSSVDVLKELTKLFG